MDSEPFMPHPLADLVADLPGMLYRGRPDRTLLAVSDGAFELTGFGSEHWSGNGACLSDLVLPEDRERVEREIAAAVGEGRGFQLSYRLRTASGQVRRVLEIGRVVAGTDGGGPMINGLLVEASSELLMGEETDSAGPRHALTDLPNRSQLMERLGVAIRRARRHAEYSFAVLYLDLDRFKLINDSLGHAQGNQMLTLVARRITSGLRQEDTVAHLNGDHFVILLDDISMASDAVRVAQRTLELLALPLYLGTEEVFISASIGIALGMSGYEHPEDPLRDAEIAMGRAKSQGGGRHQLFDRAMHHRAVARLRLETDLRHALQRREFRLYYQPIVNLIDGHIRGFEALLRWQHPKRGLIAPGEFLGVATETGLIIPMTWWILREACRQLRSWQSLFPSRPPLYVSVNLTGHQFARADLVQRIESMLVEHGLDANSLHLEITEDVLMDLDDSAGRSLAGLSELGVHLSLDDFGTGYSSLASLGQLPLHSFKIDRSFISALDVEVRGLEIVRTIVALAFNLGLEVVAEGVENQEQVDYLLSLGCRHAQGFLFARPLPSREIEALLEEQEPRPIARLA